MYKINESEILYIIDTAIEFGTNVLNEQKNKMIIQIASFWLEGYIEGHRYEITEDDIKSLRTTLKNYFFI